MSTAIPSWSPLGSGWNNIKPYPDAMPVSYDGTALVLNQHYCVRVRARGERDTGNQDVYGDFTYLDDGTGSAFQWVGYPTGGACTPTCNTGYLGADDYLLPARGTLTRLTPLITWKPIAGKQSYFVIVSKDPNFSNLADYAFTQVPAYSPRSQIRPTTYSDETTLYYWAVLPATGLNGSGAVGDPLSAAASTFQKQSMPPSQTLPADGALLDRAARLPLVVRGGRAPLPLPGRAGADVRELRSRTSSLPRPRTRRSRPTRRTRRSTGAFAPTTRT